MPTDPPHYSLEEILQLLPHRPPFLFVDRVIRIEPNQIHKTRCIFCGYCEEACPVGAIFMGKDYELAVYSKDDFVWDKEDLLVPAATSPTVSPQAVS